MKKIICYVLLTLCISSLSAQTDNVTRKKSQQKARSSAQVKSSLSQKKQATSSKPKSNYNAARSLTDILQELFANMIYVQGGEFTMGATSIQGSDAYDREKPIHQVTLSSFYICKYEVTQELWQNVMGNNPSFAKGERRPVECVSWDDCKTFISKLNSITGKEFRLPTEAEWEYAAKGGNKSLGFKYSGSNDLNNVAWFDGYPDGTTHEVGLKYPNELGLYDMSGNVAEWCSDWYGNYSSTAQSNPIGPTEGVYRVTRGGDWLNKSIFCCLTSRCLRTPSDRGHTLGFRLVLPE